MASVSGENTPLLVVEDDTALAGVEADFLQERGYRVFRAATCREAMDVLDSQVVHVALVDRKLPDGEGTRVSEHIVARGLKTKMILVTAYGMNRHIDEYLAKGAFDFLEKPFALDALLKRIQNADRMYRLEFSTGVRHSFQKSAYRMVGDSVAMEEIRRIIRHVAPLDTSVLITGETGTGKELIARNIHLDSPRSHQHFISVNCASIPENLFESEFFGYVRGAFTGAVREKAGLFEMADTGTLHLDEIGEMPLEFQAKLLRVIESGTFIKLGGNRETRVDVRLVASTNKNLEGEVEQGRFRRDLYFRIAVFTIRVPPLRERPEDIPAIAAHLWTGLYQRMGLKEVPPPASFETLVGRPWKGNVRELRNHLERELIYRRMGGEPPPVAGQAEPLREPGIRTLEEVTRDHVLAVLARLGYNKTRTAAALGIGLTTLKRRLGEWGVRIRRAVDDGTPGG